MRVLIVCKVIDNFGDAGFCLRLGRALANQGHRVDLLHDNPDAFRYLLEASPPPTLQLINVLLPEYDHERLTQPDLVLEPFGTSSEQYGNRYELRLKDRFFEVPWLLIDYLSAESWIEEVHLLQSVDSQTGHRVSYFYPGFTARTGGVIHCDWPHKTTSTTQAHSLNLNNLRVFVFCYPNAPIDALMRATQVAGDRVGMASAKAPLELERAAHWQALGFCPQTEFDARLCEHDVLMVRGEDSFVRAQLAARPLVWQIYPTEDGLHADKLHAFYTRYSAGLTEQAREALWQVWLIWNGLEPSHKLAEAWLLMKSHFVELNTNAATWRNHLLNNKELVSELLTWRANQAPTLNN